MGNEIYLPQHWEDFWQRRQNDIACLFGYILNKPSYVRVSLDDVYLASSAYQQSLESWFEYHDKKISWSQVAPDLHAIRNLQVHLRQKSQEERRYYSCDSLLKEIQTIQRVVREARLEIHGLKSMSEGLSEILTRYKNDY